MYGHKHKTVAIIARSLAVSRRVNFAVLAHTNVRDRF